MWALAAVVGLTLSSCGSRAADACASLDVTITGTSGADRLIGTPGPDVIWGGAGNDRIEGLGGDDVLCGGPGADRLSGGPGDDTVDGGADRRVTIDTDSYDWEGDTLAGGPGDDMIVPGPREGHPRVDVLTYSDAASGVRVDLTEGRATGEGNDLIRDGVGTLVGSPGDDRLFGTGRGDTISGGRGADLVDGRGGHDKLDAAGSPRVETTDREGRDLSPNQVVGGSGDDELQGAEGDDVIEGGAGNDAIYGDLGADQLSGGDGQDTISDYVLPTGDPRAATQSLDGGDGSDSLGDLYLVRLGGTDDGAVNDDGAGIVDLAKGTVRGHAGRDRFELEAANFANLSVPLGTWTVFGTADANEIITLDDKRGVIIHARGGDDQLFGSFGDDVLDGGPGHDEASGFIGNDRYVSVEKVRK